MIWRILILFGVLFVGILWLAQATAFPIDGFLTALLLSSLLIILLFAHYRFIGKLRALGQNSRALRHLWLWLLFLPEESYNQLRLQILIEGDDHQLALQQIDEAEKISRIDPAFIAGFRAEIARRKGRYREAESLLLAALEVTPPGVLRTGLCAQIARLYIHNLNNKKILPNAEKWLNEAEEYALTETHTLILQAVRGELLLAQQEPDKGRSLLRESLDNLLSHHPPAPMLSLSWPARMWYLCKSLVDQFISGQQDEHQNPFYAELCLSLGKAYANNNQPDDARTYLYCGLSLCQQTFIAQPLRDVLNTLPQNKQP
jgi:tetratricopeptide (TPR) repeat protein